MHRIKQKKKASFETFLHLIRLNRKKKIEQENTLTNDGSGIQENSFDIIFHENKVKINHCHI